MKGLDHNILCPMQCSMSGILIDEVPTFLAPVPTETIHTIQIIKPFDAIYPIIIPLKKTKDTSYFVVT